MSSKIIPQATVVNVGAPQPTFTQTQPVQQMQVVVPQGAQPGTMIMLQTAAGPMQVQVPAGLTPGMTFLVGVPQQQQPVQYRQPMGQPVPMQMPQQMPMQMPQQMPMQMSGGVPLSKAQLLQKIAGTGQFLIKQETDLFEAITQGCYEAPNYYMVKDNQTKAPLFAVRERGDKCCRCCCAPHHPLFLEFVLIDGSGRPALQAPILWTLERDGLCNKFTWCCNCMESTRDGMVLVCIHHEFQILFIFHRKFCT